MAPGAKILIIIAAVIIIGGIAAGAWAMGQDAERYEPGSQAARDLLRGAAVAAGLPASWGDDPATHELMKRESGGWVGRPNYTFGELSKVANRKDWPAVWAKLRAGETWTKSTATGLGQLLTSNAKAKYPGGLQGIGNAHAEAVGFLRYVADRYGSPAVALAMHGKTGVYTHAKTGEQKSKSFQEGY